jgi:hypothetical protein
MTLSQPQTHFFPINTRMLEHSVCLLFDEPTPRSGGILSFPSLCFTNIRSWSLPQCVLKFVFCDNIINLVPKGQAEASSVLETSLEPHWFYNHHNRTSIY